MSFSNSSFVQTDSVQSEFARLTNLRESLRREIDDRARERRSKERDIASLRETAGILSNELHKANSNMGSYSKKISILKAEHLRLQEAIKSERQQIEDANAEYDLILKKERENKKEYIEEMHILVRQLNEITQNNEDMYYMNLLNHPEAIDFVKVFAAERGINVENIIRTVALWQDGYQKRIQSMEKLNQLHYILGSYRLIARKKEPNTDFAALEEMWKLGNTAGKSDSETLFYGDEEETNGAEIVDTN